MLQGVKDPPLFPVKYRKEKNPEICTRARLPLKSRGVRHKHRKKDFREGAEVLTEDVKLF